MDNYDLSNKPLLVHCADSGENSSFLTAEENRRATFARRSATITTSEKTELQRVPLISDEQIPEQRALADFDISSSPNILDPLTVDEPVVIEPEDAFGALAAYQSFTFNDNSQHPSLSELGLGPGLGLFEGFTAEDLTDVVPADLEGNGVIEPLAQRGPLEQLWSLGQLWQLEQPEQPQGESDARGIIIPERANPDTDLNKSSGKRRASKSRTLVLGDRPESVIHKPLRRSNRLIIKRQKLDSTETKFLPLPQGTATISQSAVMPEKSTDSQNNTEQNPDKSLKEQIKKETKKWILRLERGAQRRYVCSYPNCNSTYTSMTHLKGHIFKHIGFSMYKCTYSECSDKPYFRDNTDLLRHLRVHHTNKPYTCSLCNRRYRYLDTYNAHMFKFHEK